MTLSGGAQAQGIWNIPATLLPLILTGILARGIRGSAELNNAVVAIKITVVAAFVVLGAGVVVRDNLAANPAAPGLLALVPPRELVEEGGRMVSRFGWGTGGVLTAVGVVFLAYAGFDAVSTTGMEARHPQRDLPLGILVTVLVSTVLYTLVALVLTGLVPYRDLGAEPIAHGIDRIAHLRAWSPGTKASLAFLVKAGALAGLTSGVLVMLMGQARILFAMGRDGLLPWVGQVDPATGAPRTGTLITGALVALGAGFLPLSVAAEMVSIGTLMAFALVCLAVPILRRTQPEAERPFRVPVPWVLGIAGTATSILLMFQMPRETWIRLLAWLYAGFCIYFLHGRRGSRLQAEAGMRYGSRWNDALSLLVHAGSVAAAAQACIQGWNPIVGILAGVLAVLTAHALVSNMKAQPKDG